MNRVDPYAVAVAAGGALDRAGVPYVVGGSLASIVHGEPRTTLDVDIAIHVTPFTVDRLLQELGSSFQVQADARAELLAGHSTCVYHSESFLKVDLFPSAGDGLARSERERAIRLRLGPREEDSLAVASPEDVLLRKLAWYRKSDEVLSQQWRDVLGIMKAQGSRLDQDYLARWALELDVSDLLERARGEAGPG